MNVNPHPIDDGAPDAAAITQGRLDATLPALPPNAEETATTANTASSAEEFDAPLHPGEVIDDYKILEVLGRGGMGVVYRALQMGAGRLVALKVIRGNQMGDAEAIRRFEGEARAAARIDHENLVTVYAVGQARGLHFYSMRLVQGESLSEAVRRKPLTPRRAARYVEQAARAVHAAHELGVLHRDIKPSNILVDEKHDKALIADFGLAKLQEASHELTQSGQVFGTPSYMAPEQACDSASVTPLADVYSLGATLFHLVAGQPPFQGKSLQDLLRQVLENEPPRLRSLQKGADRDLETICGKCLEKDPRRRYASAQALANDLTRYLDGEPIVARRVSALERGYRWLRRRPIAAALIAAVFVVAILAGVAGTLAARSMAAQREAAAARAWNALNDRLRHKLENPSLSPAYVGEVEEILERMRELDRPKSLEAAARFRSAQGAFLRRGVQQQRLREADFPALEAALGAFHPRDATLADELLATLRARRREWRESLYLSAPFVELATAFSPAEARLDAIGDRPRVVPATPARLWGSLLVPSERHGEIEATFDAAWERGTKLGVYFGWKPHAFDKPAPAYEFVLLSNPDSPYRRNSKDPFFKGRQENNLPLLRILRDGEIVDQASIPWSALPAGPITLRARRDGAKLEIQVNREPPLEIEEIFPKDALARGHFAVLWPAGAGLTSLRILAPLETHEASPLETADRLFAEGRFEEALAGFDAVLERPDSAAIRDEARFKRGACLVELKRFSEAEPVLMELALQLEGVWPARAAFLVWREHLSGRRYEEADSIGDFVITRYSSEKIGEVIPIALRQDVADAYLYRRRNPAEDKAEALRRHDRVSKVCLALAATPAELRYARYVLARDLVAIDERARAIEMYKSLEADPHLPVAWLLECIEWHAHLLSLEDRAAEGVFLISRGLARPPLRDYDFHRDLLVTRAALLCGQNRLAEARADLENFENFNRSADMNTFLHYFLLRGIVEDKLGNREAALRNWREGLSFLRRRAREINELEIYNNPFTPILGSLSEAFTDEDIDTALSAFLSGGLPWNFVKGIFPLDIMYTVPKYAWRTAEGRRWAERVATLRATYEEMAVLPVRLDIGETIREALLNTTDVDRPLTADEYAFVWNATDMVFDHFKQRKAGEVEALLMFQSINGQTGLLGWQSLAPRISAELRQSFELFLGCRFRNQGKLEEARRFMTAALASAPPDSPVSRLAKTALDELEAPKPPEEPKAAP